MIRAGHAAIAATGALALWTTAATAVPSIVSVTATPPGWNRTDRVDLTWSVAGAQPYLSGLRIEVNTAADGSGDGQWVTVAVRTPLDAATGVLSGVPLAGMQGIHAVRATAWDQTGSTVAFPAPLLLDHTPPVVNRVEVTGRTPTSVTLAWTQADAHAGLAPDGSWLEVAGRGDGVFDHTALRIPVDAVPGARTAVIDLAGAPDGARPVRLRSTDRAGNVALTALPPVWIDHTPPVVSDATVAQWPTPQRLSAQIDYTAADAIAGVPVNAPMAVVDVATGAVLARGTAGPGRQSVFVDLPDGTPRHVAVVVHDAVGNAGRSAPIALDPTAPAVTVPADASEVVGAASVRHPYEARLADATIGYAITGVRALKARTAGLPTIPLRFGAPAVITGSLTSPRGPIGGMELEAWDRQGRTIATGTTAADGSFRLVARPVASGPVRVGVPVADRLLPATPARLAVRVGPRLTLTASRRVTRAGGPAVVFTGRVAPTPGLVGVPSKNVVIEWRDPLRGMWRPMVNTRVGRTGVVRARWRFNGGGFRVPVRLRLVAEPGWPTEAGVSRAVTIVVK